MIFDFKDYFENFFVSTPICNKTCNDEFDTNIFLSASKILFHDFNPSFHVSCVFGSILRKSNNYFFHS